MKLQPIHSRTILRLILASSIGIAIQGCATRESRATLGNQWPASEPTVNLGAYENVQKRPGQRSDVAVAVAISGGGMRAANFAAGVLKALEQTPVRGANGRISNLLREVDYFSTVSGGGLAAGSYIAHLNQHLRQVPGDPEARGFSFAAGGGDESGRNWRKALAENYQSSIVGSFFNPLMAGRLDRGDILERRLDEYVLGRSEGRSLTLGDVFKPKGTTPLMPYWVTNGTVFENGAIFPFTPDVLAQYGITGYNHRLASRRLKTPEDMPLAVGLKTSASFPVAIPPTTMKSDKDPRHPLIHLMDGGVADNLGVITAVRLLRQDKAKHKVLIVIDAYNGKVEPFSKGGLRPGMLSTALRTTSISLESSHQRIDNLLETVAGPSSIRYAVIDFTRALNAKDDQPSAPADGLMDLLGIGSMKRDETSPQSIQAVFTQALGVGTWFKIDKAAQKALLQAGESAIYIQNPEAPTAGRKLLKEMRSIRDAF